MDDLEFRRRAYAEPDSEDKEFLEKKNESADNARFVEELKMLDQHIADAMQVEPPEGLAERIKLNQQLGEHTQTKKQYRFMMSIAASVLIVMSVVFTFLSPSTGEDLTKEVLAHIYDELDHLDVHQHEAIDSANLVLASHGGKFNHPIGELRYVGGCDIDKKPGLHMVLEGEKGPVTVMMMPQSKIEKAIQIADGRFQGSIEPTMKGSYAIVAEKGEKIEREKRVVNSSLSWQF